MSNYYITSTQQINNTDNQIQNSYLITTTTASGCYDPNNTTYWTGSYIYGPGANSTILDPYFPKIVFFGFGVRFQIIQKESCRPFINIDQYSKTNYKRIT